jgi:hypothetical protein
MSLSLSTYICVPNQEKTITNFSNYHTLRRVSKFELVEALDDFGLQM